MQPAPSNDAESHSPAPRQSTGYLSEEGGLTRLAPDCKTTCLFSLQRRLRSLHFHVDSSGVAEATTSACYSDGIGQLLNERT